MVADDAEERRRPRRIRASSPTRWLRSWGAAHESTRSGSRRSRPVVERSSAAVSSGSPDTPPTVREAADSTRREAGHVRSRPGPRSLAPGPSVQSAAMPLEDPGDDGPNGPPPDPLDRLWVHPSELSARSRPTPPPPRPAGRSREWFLMLAAGATGALVATGVARRWPDSSDPGGSDANASPRPRPRSRCSRPVPRPAVVAVFAAGDDRRTPRIRRRDRRRLGAHDLRDPRRRGDAPPSPAPTAPIHAATIRGLDRATDLALLRVDGLDGGLSARTDATGRGRRVGHRRRVGRRHPQLGRDRRRVVGRDHGHERHRRSGPGSSRPTRSWSRHVGRGAARPRRSRRRGAHHRRAIERGSRSRSARRATSPISCARPGRPVTAGSVSPAATPSIGPDGGVRVDRGRCGQPGVDGRASVPTT